MTIEADERDTTLRQMALLLHQQCDRHGASCGLETIVILTAVFIKGWGVEGHHRSLLERMTASVNEMLPPEPAPAPDAESDIVISYPVIPN